MEIAATVRSALAVSVLASGVGALVATNAAPPSWAVRPSSADQLKRRPQNSHLLISPHSKLSVGNRIDLLCSSRRCVERRTCSVTALQYKKKSSRCDNSWELWQPASSANAPLRTYLFSCHNTHKTTCRDASVAGFSGSIFIQHQRRGSYCAATVRRSPRCPCGRRTCCAAARRTCSSRGCTCCGRTPAQQHFWPTCRHAGPRPPSRSTFGARNAQAARIALCVLSSRGLASLRL